MENETSILHISFGQILNAFSEYTRLKLYAGFNRLKSLGRAPLVTLLIYLLLNTCMDILISLLVEIYLW